MTRVESVSVPKDLLGTEGIVEIHPRDIRGGDRIVACRHESWDHWSVWSTVHPYTVSIVGARVPVGGSNRFSYKMVYESGDKDERYDDQMLLVVRAGAAAAASPPAGPSRWNGRCPLCGRGTYQGFMSLEHEGGGCDAG